MRQTGHRQILLEGMNGSRRARESRPAAARLSASPMPRLRARQIDRRGRAPTTPSRSTTTRSASATASATSWVMSTVVKPCSRQMRASSSCISARVSASSAPNGSSRSSTPGRLTSARASATRCFWPPESTDGQSLARSARPTSASAAVRRFAPARLARDADIADHPLPQQQARILEEQPDRALQPDRPARRRSGPRPAVGVSSPAISRSSVVLPPPERPTTARNCPAGIERSSACSTGRARRSSSTTPSSATGWPSLVAEAACDDGASCGGAGDRTSERLFAKVADGGRPAHAVAPACS